MFDTFVPIFQLLLFIIQIALGLFFLKQIPIMILDFLLTSANFISMLCFWGIFETSYWGELTEERSVAVAFIVTGDIGRLIGDG